MKPFLIVWRMGSLSLHFLLLSKHLPHLALCHNWVPIDRKLCEVLASTPVPKRKPSTNSFSSKNTRQQSRQTWLCQNKKPETPTFHWFYPTQSYQNLTLNVQCKLLGELWHHHLSGTKADGGFISTRASMIPKARGMNVENRLSAGS